MAASTRSRPAGVVVACLLVLALLYGWGAVSGDGFGRARGPVVAGVMAVAVLALLGWFLVRRRRGVA